MQRLVGAANFESANCRGDGNENEDKASWDQVSDVSSHVLAAKRTINITIKTEYREESKVVVLVLTLQ